MSLILTTFAVSGLVIDQTRKDGFRFRTVEEFNQRERTSTEEIDRKDNETNEGDDEKRTGHFVEDVKN